MHQEKPGPAEHGAVEQQGLSQAGTDHKPAANASPGSLFSTPNEAELQAACVRTLRERGLLVDAERLAGRAAIRLLRDQSQDGGGTGRDLALAIEAALDEIDNLDREAERHGALAANPLEGDHAFLIHALGIPPLLARAAALEFNGLDEPVRMAFFAHVIQGKRLESDPTAQGPGNSARIAAMVRRALQALFLVGPHAGGGEQA